MFSRSVATCLAVLAALSSLAGCSADTSTDGASEDEARAAKPRARWVCREYDRGTQAAKQRTVVIEQTDDQGLTEGKKLGFSIDLYKGAENYPELSAKGIAQTEDVSFNFKSSDGKVGFNIYLDEMNESGLTLNGQDSGDFVCMSGHLVCSDYDRATKQLKQQTLVLTKTDRARLVEGRKTAFELETFTGGETYNGAASVKGTVETEDVSFTFTSDDKKVELHHFMDEIEEASLKMNGQKRGDLICR